MTLIEIFFWVAFFLIFYSYLGYGIFLWCYLKVSELLHKKKALCFDNYFLPEVTVVIAIFNEEQFISEKIKNCFELDYPKDKINFLVVADGSNDESVNIVTQYDNIDLWYKPERQGKSAAINRVMPHINSPVTIFTDANTFLNKQCVRNIVRHYQDTSVGAVAGEKKITTKNTSLSTAGAGEGLYWKYESFLKKMDSRFYSVVGAAGELFSIRTNLYEQVDNNILLDDFIISMKICLKGYKVKYEPDSYAEELPSFSLKEEQKRKIRIAAGGFQSVVLLKSLLNIFKYKRLSFQYISHRVMRWILCPMLLPTIWILNLVLCLGSENQLYCLMFLFQNLFYLAAIVGWLFAIKNLKVPLLYIAYYFTFMNIAMYYGFLRFIRNTQTVLWEKAKRAE